MLFKQHQRLGQHFCPCTSPPVGGRSPARQWHAQQRRRCLPCAPAKATANGPPLGIVLECDGVVIDAHREGHRVAFNRAFSDVGMDSMKWNPSVYHDLLRSGDGSPEGMIRAFFDAVGWPSKVPTAARRSFVAEMHDLKRKHLKEMVQAREIPLRTGVAEFVRDALEAGAKLGTITCTASTADERLHEAALAALGPSLAGQLMVFSSGDTEPGGAEGSSARGSAASEDSPGGLSLEAQFSRQVAQRKQDEASAFISSLKADSESSVPLGIDPQLLVAAKRGRGPVSAAFLAACVASIMDVPLRRCAVIAANSSLMQAARSAGMVSIAVPSALSARGRFVHADATCDGFGSGGGLTLRRVQALLAKAYGA